MNLDDYLWILMIFDDIWKILENSWKFLTSPDKITLDDLWQYKSSKQAKRLTSRDKIEPLYLCQLLISVNCQYQFDYQSWSIRFDIDLGQLLISVDCGSQLIVDISWLMIMTDLLMFWSQTNSLTDGLTMIVVKMLLQLKKITVRNDEKFKM